MLVPLQVQNDYVDRVLLAVERYGGRDGQPARPSAVERWREACRSKEGLAIECGRELKMDAAMRLGDGVAKRV
jgi:hypothetical protein